MLVWLRASDTKGMGTNRKKVSLRLQMLNGTVQFPKVSVTPRRGSRSKDDAPGNKLALEIYGNQSEYFCLETSYLHFEPHPYKFEFENIELAPFLTYTKGGDRDW